MSTKHKHAEMIKAKVDNMELTWFVKTCHDGAWYEKVNVSFQWWDDSEYFLCLPQHKEACLHWLNGGDVECRSSLTRGEWSGCYPIGRWHAGLGVMREDAEYRIKPKKEKRYIAYNSEGEVTSQEVFSSGIECEDYIAETFGLSEGHNWQFIEIEILV